MKLVSGYQVDEESLDKVSSACHVHAQVGYKTTLH